MNNNLKILLVDDRLENLVALEKILGSLKVQFFRAISGHEALALILDHDFALALIDVQMPVMDGYETVEIMRQGTRTEFLSIIFISAIYSENYHMIRGVESGAVDFITKPVVPEIILGKVKIFLDLYRQRKELEFRERQFRTLYNKTPTMLHSIDKEGFIVSVSDYWCEKMGYKKDEVVGRQSTDFFTETSKTRTLEIIIPRFIEAMYDVPCSFITKSGDIIEVLMSSISENDSTGHFVRSMAVMIDVTEKNRVARKLEIYAEEMTRRNEEMKQYTSIVSHDLKVPLSSIQGFTDILRSDIEGVEKGATCPRRELKDSLDYISLSVESMSALIDKLSEVSKAGGRELKLENIDLNILLDKICDSLAHFIQKGSVKIHYKNLPTLYADELGLSQAITNLLKNAILYRDSTRDAEICVVANVQPDSIEIHIKDNGVGMDEETKKMIFQPFKRGHNDGIQGEGLGLSYTQAIVRAHGGMIWCDSFPGEGTTFTISLPRPLKERQDTTKKSR